MGWSGPVTHRQHLVIRKWLHDDWEKPSRTDRYIMRLTAIVDGMFRKEPVPEDTYRLKYERSQPMQTKSTSTPTTAQRHAIDPTGQTVIVPPCPDTLSQEESRVKEFMGDADPSTIIDAQSDDKAWKRSRRVWLRYAGIATDADGNVVKKDK